MKIHRNLKIGQHNYKIFANKNQINKKQKLNILHFPKKIKFGPTIKNKLHLEKISQIKFTKFKKMQRKISLLQPAGPK